MIKSNKLVKLFALFLIASSFSNSMAISKYKVCPLPSLSVKTDDESINFNYHIFNKSDCKKYLGRTKFFERGYQPIQIKIANNSNVPVQFSTESFSVNCIPVDQVIEGMQFSTTSRVVGWFAGSLFFFPFIIPTIIEAIEAPKANNKIEVDYSNKSLESQIIEPHTSINGLIFVSRGKFNSEFGFTMTNNQNNSKLALSTFNKSIKV